ncbi:MAG: 2-succinyl-5-enolpyruvyl-6-hydroxy-3-cyclohexene-1-carboxylic-acid synthase [Candidatus Omnitrophica bacterium]|nr:2-succinyl-5-enolpyruvyl-6-hydroxy-3-cyclohexene-1-carboxylic-acid synthase [Candidatus Omnitrophota bacterium]
MRLTSSNPNLLWPSLIIEELIRNGVEYFCLAPGSRSSPLAVAVATNPRAKSFVHFDERALAFHALGYASATRKACAVITTSGTAAANLFPAIIEASKKKLPLVVLTADRPPELRYTGANQTIDQVKIFGDYVRWQFDMPCPTTDIPANFVLTTVDQAIFRANGELKGPVHINCMYREPLVGNNRGFVPAELKRWQNARTPYTSYFRSGDMYLYSKGKRYVSPEINAIAERIRGIKHGIIVVGKLAGEREQKSVLALAEKLNWPVFPDVTSGLRLGCRHKNVISYFDQILLGRDRSRPVPTGILHLGGRITSQRWYDYVEAAKPAHYIMVLNHPLRNDPLHGVTLRVQARVDDFCDALIKKVTNGKANPFLSSLQKLNQQVDRTIEEYFGKKTELSEAAAARLVTRHIPADSGLFLGNSLPIREVDMYADPKGKSVVIGANRGASGIDGTVASACGFAAGLGRATTLIIGDLAFLYDLNSLAMLKNAPQPLIIVALNNDGGGIFNFLPISQFRDGFEKFFGTPHGLTFQAAAEMFDLNYANPATKDDFIRAYQVALHSNTSTLIEVTSDRKQNVALTKGLQERIRKVLGERL